MILKKTPFLVALSFIFSIQIYGQKIILGDSVEVTFCKLGKKISDSSQLKVVVVYKNLLNRPIYVYDKLSSGDLNDRFHNINIELQKEEKGNYVSVIGMYYKPNPDLYFADSLRHYDLPKDRQPSFGIDTLTFDLYRLGAGFEAGKYRLKIYLRSQTILDNTVYHYDPTGSSMPPLDTIKYISSNWIYFETQGAKTIKS